jgi:class 3 adenylate cyclase
MTAFITLNPDDYMRHLARDDTLIVIGTGPGEIARGYSAVRTMLSEQLAELRGMTMEPLWDAVWRRGDVAWSSGEMSFKATLLDGGTWRGVGRYTGVFVHDDERWYATSLHFSVPDTTPTNGTLWPHSVDELASVVAFERPDLRQQVAPDGMLTLLFTDIEGSTELNTRLGDIRWMEAVREHNRIVRDLVAAHSGTEVKTIGDAFMIAFPSARRAVLFAIATQRAFEAYNREHEGEEIRLRIGLHAGEPMREGTDFFGRSVTEASRIAGVARGGEILVSSLLRELVDPAGDLTFDGGRTVELKGLPGERVVYGVGH